MKKKFLDTLKEQGRHVYKLLVFAEIFFVYFVFPVALARGDLPDPDKLYAGFWDGLVGGSHGALLAPNYIFSFFDGNRLFKAVSYDWWYNLNWWGAVFGFPIKLFMYTRERVRYWARTLAPEKDADKATSELPTRTIGAERAARKTTRDKRSSKK
jgi:hypothetical protein